MFEKPLRAFSTKDSYESAIWLRVINSGMVIMKKIGQLACLLPKIAMIDYGRASETERIWVSDDGLINQNWLKIQSSPIGNFWDKECLFKLKARLLYIFFYTYHNKIEIKIHNINNYIMNYGAENI